MTIFNTLFHQQKELFSMGDKHMFWRLLSLALLLIISSSMAMADILTLNKAESLALANAKELAVLQNEQQIQEKKALANNHLQSPSLHVGGDYPKEVLPALPTHETTTVMVGVKQSLTPLSTQTLQLAADTHLTQAYAAQINQMKTFILHQVRQNWLNLYENLQMQRLLERQLTANPTGNPQLQIQLTQVHLQETILREHLKQQIGELALTVTLPETLPAWTNLPGQSNLEAQLSQNPQLEADSHYIRASQQSVKLAGEPRNSGLNLNVGYGFDQSGSASSLNSFNINDKANLITFALTIPLSSTTNASQDEEINKHVQRLEIHQQKQREDFLALKKLLVATYHDWRQYNKQVANCENSSNTIQSIPVQLNCLHVAVSRAKSQAEIYYLIGK
jgi:outer membrane protein TolC